MTWRWRHPIHALPFDDEIANALEVEYREQAFGRRVAALRKAAAREALLALTGQTRLHLPRVPAATRRVLWVYTWTTVGDAIMDLAPRRLIPAGIEVDLLIAPALAPLFTTDRRFRAVHTDAARCPAGDYDFVLLDSLRTEALRTKMRRFAALRFASMRGHHAGERFDRAAYADRRVRQLFGLATGPVEAPRLDLGADVSPAVDHGRFRIAVALGARVPRKLYPHWQEALTRIVERWPHGAPRPEFRLLGQGEPARRQLAALDSEFVRAHGVSQIDGGSLRDAANEIAACDAFIGVDGGLMHVAIGVGIPGLALFTRIDPAYFVRPQSAMVVLRTEADLSRLPGEQVAAAFVAALPPRFSLLR